MNALAHIVPALGVAADLDRGGGYAGSGIATAALQTADRFAGPVDLVLVAVEAGRGEAFVLQLLDMGAVSARTY